jgi:hypothetical protein
MLDNPIARSQWARKLVDDTAPKKDELDDARDVLTPFDRDIVGAASVTIKLPLRDPTEVRRHLALIEETARALRLRLEKRDTDRGHLFMVRGAFRSLHQKLNAYRTPRKD